MSLNVIKAILVIISGILSGVQPALSQQKLVDIRVVVTDTSDAPVENAIISIIDQNGSGFSFEFTDKNGEADLSFIQNDGESDIHIKITAVTYHTQLLPLLDDKKVYKVQLKQNPDELTEVLVNGPDGPRIVRKDDTLSYSTADFRLPNDRTIGDVLQRIPGVELSESGVVYFMGRPISNLYIDGDDLFNDKYGILLKNLQAGLIDSVEVIDNNQQMKILQGKKSGTDPAINLRMKTRSKDEVLNSLEVAGGLPEQYDLSIQSMLFKPSFKTVNTAKSNDAGQSYLAETVPFQRNSKWQKWNEKNEFTDFLSAGRYSSPSLNMNRWLFNNSQMLSLNNLWKAGNQNEIRVNANALRELDNMDYGNTLNYYAYKDTIEYSETGSEKSKNNYYDLTANYNTNHSKLFLNNELKVHYRNRFTSADLLSLNQHIDQQLEQKDYGISNTFRTLHLLKNRLIGEVYSNIAFSSRPEVLDVFPGVQERIINSGRKYFCTTQNIEFDDFSTTNALGISSLRERFFQSYTAGFNYNRQSLNTSLIGISDNKEIIDPGEGFSGKEKFIRFRPFFVGEWIFHTEKHELSASVYFKSSFIRFENDSTFERAFVTANPSIGYKLKTGKESNMIIKASIDHEEGNIEDLYPSVILSDFRTLLKKRLPFLKERSRTIAGRFNFQKTAQLLVGHVGLSYSSKHLNYITSYKLSPTAVEIVALPYENEANTLAFNAVVSKYLNPIKANIEVKGSGTISNSQRIQQSVLLPVKNLRLGYEINLIKKLESFLTLAYQVKYNRFKATMENTAGNEFEKHSSALTNRFVLNAFPGDHWKLNVGVNSKHNRIEDMTSYHYVMIDASLKYQFSNPDLEISVEGSNLNGAKNYQEIYMVANNLLINDFNLRPPSFMLRCSFNF